MHALPGDAQAIADAIEGHVAAPDEEPGKSERDRHTKDAATNAEKAVAFLRRFIEQQDEDEKPFVRVVGRIVYILTGEGGRSTCTATPIFVALLLHLREHLDPVHRQSGTNRQAIDVTAPNLQRVVYRRLEKLASKKWLEMLQQGVDDRDYWLTEDGRFVFNGWPEDIAFDPSNTDLWERKRPYTVGKTSVPLLAK